MGVDWMTRTSCGVKLGLPLKCVLDKLLRLGVPLMLLGLLVGVVDREAVARVRGGGLVLVLGQAVEGEVALLPHPSRSRTGSRPASTGVNTA